MDTSNIFNSLKGACNAKNTYTNFNDLEIGSYNVNHFELADTKFGPRIAVYLDLGRIYLPARFNASIKTQDQIDELNKAKNVMHYLGKDMSRCNRVLLDFTQVIATPAEQ